MTDQPKKPRFVCPNYGSPLEAEIERVFELDVTEGDEYPRLVPVEE